MSHAESSLAGALPAAAARQAFQAGLLVWGDRHARPFYWREPGLSTLELLLLEVLLTRTRAAAVVPVLGALMARYPDAGLLAAAAPADLEVLLRPLGLFRKRARALVPLAQALVERHGGAPPNELGALLALPYVGRYAANAFLCFGVNARRPVVDANVARLFARYWGLAPPRGKLDSATPYWELAEHLLPLARYRAYNWALLNLGALVCTPRKPRCGLCPLAETCVARRAGDQGPV